MLQLRPRLTCWVLASTFGTQGASLPRTLQTPATSPWPEPVAGFRAPCAPFPGSRPLTEPQEEGQCRGTAAAVREGLVARPP